MLSKINFFSAKYIISYYFLLSGIEGVFLMLGMGSLMKMNMIIAFVSIFIAIEQLIEKRRFIDWFIIVFIAVITIYSSYLYYDSTLFHYGFRYQMLLMILFIVGESKYMADWNLFDKAKIPIIVIAIIGLALFFFSPSWYVSYKLSTHDVESNEFFLEITRLSAFWPYPYWISYGCGILYYYILCQPYILKRKLKNKDILIMCFLLLVLIFSQQRAPLAFVFIATLVFFIVSVKKKSIINKNFRNKIVFLVIIIAITLYISMFFIDTERLSFMLDKVIALGGNRNANFIETRFSMFSNVAGGGGSSTLLGQGIGRFSHAAYYLGKPAVTDNQYLSIYYETGYIGCIGYALIFGLVLLKGLRNFKNCIFELGIVLFYLMAMSGANPLSVQQEHTLIFWICCGRIFSKDCISYKKAEFKSIRT